MDGGSPIKLNAGKTLFLTMGTKERLRNLGPELKVEMDGVILKDKRELLLGIIIQNDLDWSEQVKALLKKLKQRLGGLQSLKYIMNSSHI